MATEHAGQNPSLGLVCGKGQDVSVTDLTEDTQLMHTPHVYWALPETSDNWPFRVSEAGFLETGKPALQFLGFYTRMQMQVKQMRVRRVGLHLACLEHRQQMARGHSPEQMSVGAGAPEGEGRASWTVTPSTVLLVNL